jgi:hypothetical protein
MCGQNDDVAIRGLLPGSGGGAGAEIGDKISQSFRSPGIGYDYRMTRIDQMTSKRACYITCTDKSYFHNSPPAVSATFIGVMQ